MKQLIIMWSNNSSGMSVEKLGPLTTYASSKAPCFYISGEHSSVACIYQGDSTRTFEFDGVVYDPKTTGDIIKLYAALEFYLLEVSLGGVLS